jgi:hypothetical protein
VLEYSELYVVVDHVPGAPPPPDWSTV